MIHFKTCLLLQVFINCEYQRRLSEGVGEADICWALQTMQAGMVEGPVLVNRLIYFTLKIGSIS